MEFLLLDLLHQAINNTFYFFGHIKSLLVDMNCIEHVGKNWIMWYATTIKHRYEKLQSTYFIFLFQIRLYGIRISSYVS